MKTPQLNLSVLTLKCINVSCITNTIMQRSDSIKGESDIVKIDSYLSQPVSVTYCQNGLSYLYMYRREDEP